MFLALLLTLGTCSAPCLGPAPAALEDWSLQSDTLSLKDALAEAQAAFPLSRRIGLEEQITSLAALDIGSALRPDLTFSTQAVWQSRVLNLPFTLPGGSSLSIPHDQYKAALTFSKVVWDGGRVQAGRTAVLARPALVRAEVDVSLVDVRNGVLVAYFGILEQDVRLKSLEFLSEDIESRLAQLESGVAAGVRRATDADVFRAEILKIRQQMLELNGARRGLLESLSISIGRTLPLDTRLEIDGTDPAATDPSATTPAADARRPEFDLFEAQTAVATRAAEVTAASRRPAVSVFAETAVGRPAGQDFFDDQIRPFASAGVRLNWSVLDWGRTRRARESATLRSEVILASQAAFEQGLMSRLAAERHIIDALEESAELDEQIVALKRRVTGRVAIELQNGTATASDFLLEKNAEYQAELVGTIRQIRIALAKARYHNTAGGR